MSYIACRHFNVCSPVLAHMFMNSNLLLYCRRAASGDLKMSHLALLYDTLRAGGSLREDHLAAIANAHSYELAALGFQIARKTQLTDTDRRVLADLAKKSPEAAWYLAKLFPNCGMGSPQEVRESALARDNLAFLMTTSRDASTGASRLRKFVTDFVEDRISREFVAIWLMKVSYDGLSQSDVWEFTMAMRDSGKVYDYRDCAGIDRRYIIRRYPTGALSEKIAIILPGLFATFFPQMRFASPF